MRTFAYSWLAGDEELEDTEVEGEKAAREMKDGDDDIDEDEDGEIDEEEVDEDDWDDEDDVALANSNAGADAAAAALWLTSSRLTAAILANFLVFDM